MRNEPEIVKLLRKEESQGLLKNGTQDTSFELAVIDEENIYEVATDSSTAREETRDIPLEDPSHFLKEPYDIHKLIFENANDVIIYTNRIGTILAINKKVEAFFGFRQEEVIGKNVFRLGFFSLKDTPKMIKLFKTTDKKEDVYDSTGKTIKTIELQMKRKNGQIAYIEASTSTIIKNRKLTGFLIVLRDITDRKQMVDALCTSEQRYRTIVENTSDMIMLTRPDGIISYVSPSCKDVVGYDETDLVNKLPWIIYEQDLAHVQQYFAQALQGSKGNQIEYRVKTKQGEIKWVSHSWAPIVENEKINMIVSIVRDVNQRKYNDEQVKTSEEKYRNLFETCPDGILTITPEGVITSFNHASEQMTGFCREEIIGKNFSSLELIFPKENLAIYYNIFNEIKQGKKPGTIHASFRHKNGEIRYVETHFNYIRNNEEIVEIQCISRDITERKKIEEIIVKSETRFRELTEMLPESIFEMTLDGQITFANTTGLKFFGYTIEDMKQGLNAFQIVVPEQHELLKKNIQKMFKEMVVYPEEYTVVTKNGQQFTALINTNFILDDRKNPIGLRGILVDITERKKAEEQLHLAVTQLKELDFIVNHSNAIAFLWRATEGWPVEFVTENILQYGYTKDDFQSGKIPYASIIFKEDVHRVGTEVEQYSQQGLKEFSQQYRIVTKTGAVRWIDDHTWIRRDINGIITHYQGIIIDITDHKLAENALKQREQQLKNIVEHSNEMFYAHDLHNKFTYVSPQCLQILGYNPEEMMRDWTELLTDNPLNKTAMDLTQIALKTGTKQQPYLIEVYRIDQKRIFLEVDESPIKDVDGNTLGTVGALRDVTELKKAYHQIEDLLKQKDDFINQLGHDLKTPLFPLINLLPMIKNAVSDPKSKERLEVAIQSVYYMKELVIKTLSLAKLNSPDYQLNLEQINLLSEINRIIDGNQLLLNEHRNQVINKLDSVLNAKADKLRFEELIENLISNAIKYSPDNSSIIIDGANQDNYILISISDDGYGLTKEQSERIFQEFYKVDESRQSLESSGLGLPICKRIVEKHGGRIWVESPGPGKGSTFYFTLPKNN